ncbi:hypothetical protein GCM10029964_037200 [Kibdelosporangium lantanae]
MAVGLVLKLRRWSGGAVASARWCWLGGAGSVVLRTVGSGSVVPGVVVPGSVESGAAELGRRAAGRRVVRPTVTRPAAHLTTGTHLARTPT